MNHCGKDNPTCAADCPAEHQSCTPHILNTHKRLHLGDLVLDSLLDVGDLRNRLLVSFGPGQISTDPAALKGKKRGVPAGLGLREVLDSIDFRPHVDEQMTSFWTPQTFATWNRLPMFVAHGSRSFIFMIEWPPPPTPDFPQIIEQSNPGGYEVEPMQN